MKLRGTGHIPNLAVVSEFSCFFLIIIINWAIYFLFAGVLYFVCIVSLKETYVLKISSLQASF